MTKLSNIINRQRMFVGGELGNDTAALLEEQAQEIESLKVEHQQCCKLVAQMHKAATGNVIGPKLGVVEDVKALFDNREELRADLTEREAECLKLREAGESVCKSLEHPTESVNALQMWKLRDALSTLPSASYLEQWERGVYQVVAYVSIDTDTKPTSDLINCELPIGTALYTRKD